MLKCNCIGEFLTERDAETYIPVLINVADGADIYKGWIEDWFNTVTMELGDTFCDSADFPQLLIAFDDALDLFGDIVKIAQF